MKFSLVAVAVLAGVTTAHNAVLASTCSPGMQRLAPPTGGPGGTDATLWDNGPVATGSSTVSGVAAPAGFEWSEVTAPNITSGFGNALTGTGPARRVADDFTIPAGEAWNIDGFRTFHYQLNAPPGTQPATSGSFNVWSGRPGDIGSIVVGGATWGTATDTNIYRILSTPANTPSTARLLRQADWDAAITLGSGTYWIDFQTIPATGTNLFSPLVTTPGSPSNPAWNGRQNATLDTWVDVVDIGTGFNLDFPFLVRGTIVPAPVSLALFGAGSLLAARRRR